MKFKYISIMPVIFIIILSGCSSTRYDLANRFFRDKKYAAAIEHYDSFINKGKNGAMVTNAELERAECYYQLGIAAMNRIDWSLAIRFFFLSNIKKSDERMVDCYYELCLREIERKKFDKALDYYDKVIINIPYSARVPDFIYGKMKIYFDIKNDTKTVWKLYQELYDKYPSSSRIEDSKKLVDTFIEQYINDALAKYDAGNHEDALKSLFNYSRYPSSFSKKINVEIANLYIDLAEKDVVGKLYLEAEKKYRAAVVLDSSKNNLVYSRLVNICNLFVMEGNKLLNNRDVKAAISAYKKSFDIIPGFKAAKQGIKKAEKLRENIIEGNRVYLLASEEESRKNYSKALRLYREAYKIDKISEYKEKIFTMKNMVLIEKDPVAFVKRVMKEYKKGIIQKRIGNLEFQLKKEYPKEVETSGWRYLLSVGEGKYEVRYDIITPDNSYFFVWLVDLQDRSVNALNTISEEITK